MLASFHNSNQLHRRYLNSVYSDLNISTEYFFYWITNKKDDLVHKSIVYALWKPVWNLLEAYEYVNKKKTLTVSANTDIVFVGLHKMAPCFSVEEGLIAPFCPTLVIRDIYNRKILYSFETFCSMLYLRSMISERKRNNIKNMEFILYHTKVIWCLFTFVVFTLGAVDDGLINGS